MIEGLNKIFESRVRLGIMSVLIVNEWVDFITLKELLKVTDGNLASHINALDKKDLILIKKEFVGKKPKTSFQVTALGRIQFKKHLSALEKLLLNNK